MILRRALLLLVCLMLMPLAARAAGGTIVLRAPGGPIFVVGPTNAERMTVTVGDRTLRSGRFSPLGRAPLGHAITFVPLGTLPAGTPIVVRVEPPSAGAPRLLVDDPVIAESVFDGRITGIVLGILIAALLLQIAWWMIARDESVPIYAFIVVVLIFIVLLRDGMLPGTAGVPALGWLSTLDALASVVYLAFAIVYLRLWKDARGLFWVAIIAIVPPTAVHLASAAIPAMRPSVELVRSPLLLFESLVLLGIAIVRGRRFPPAYYLLTALVATTLSILYRTIRVSTSYADPLLDRWAFEIGSTIDVVVFAFAVFARQHYLWRERKLLQARLEEATHAAQHDALTGVLNRRGLNSHLAERDGGTLLYVDLDNFKEVNDRFGHATGDTVLVDVSQLLREHAGASATIARIGGDEFVVVVAETDRAAIELLADRLCDRIRRIRIAGRNRLPQFGASIGYAPLAGLTLDNAMRIADANAYRTKAYKRASQTPPAL
jgi:diguanylate cyclase (GGDEF)-like protein